MTGSSIAIQIWTNWVEWESVLQLHYPKKAPQSCLYYLVLFLVYAFIDFILSFNIRKWCLSIFLEIEQKRFSNL